MMLIRGLGYPAVLAAVATLFTLALYFLPTVARGRPLLAGILAAALTGITSALFVYVMALPMQDAWFVALLLLPIYLAESTAIALAAGLIVGSALAVFRGEAAR